MSTGFSPSDFELGGLCLGRVEVLAAGAGQIEIDAGIHGFSPMLLRLGFILYLIEGLPEHGIMGLLPVQQEIDGLPHAFIVDLPVQVLVDHLGALLGGDIGEDVRCV